MTTLTERDLSYFREVCGPHAVLHGDDISEDYAHDEMPEYGKFMPEAVLLPTATQQVAKILQHCNARGIAVTPRGAGTGLCGGAVAIEGGIVLSLVNMNRIVSLDESRLTVTVEPGVLHMELTRYLADFGLFYPPDPGEKTATLGGNIMTNAGGMRAVKYGVTRDWVAGLEAVTATGDVLTFSGPVNKNSSGYSLKDLIIGSEGTLAVVTQAVLRVLPLPQAHVSLLIPYPSIQACIDTTPKIMRAHLSPTAVEFMQREVLTLAEQFLGKRFPDTSADAYLLLRFDGPSARALQQDIDAAAEVCLQAGALDVLIADTDERQDVIWTMRGAFLEAIKSSAFSMDECDVVVPIDQIAEFLAYVREVEAEVGRAALSFGHAGDGNLHIYLLRTAEESEEAWNTACDLFMTRLYDRAHALGGQVSGEHGIGHAKAVYLRALLGDTQVHLMRSIKQTFDPKGILNPGKVCP